MIHVPFVLAAAIGKAVLAHGAAAAVGHAAAPVAHAALTHTVMAHAANTAIQHAAGFAANQVASAAPAYAALHVTPVVTHPAVLTGVTSTPGWLDQAMGLFEWSFLVAGAAKIIKDTPLPEELKTAALQLLSHAPQPVPGFSAADFSS